MPTYEVQTPVLYSQIVEIKADSKEDAIQAVKDGDGKFIEGTREYVDIMEEATFWAVEKDAE